MTVTYTFDVSKVRLLGFSRLLFRWKGGIYKLLYREILIYILLYGAISSLYRFVLTGVHKRNFELSVFYFSNFESLIPVTFILGFYVTFVAQRWWSQYINIPWPDKIMTYLVAHVRGTDLEARLTRRTVIRYLLLSEVILFQSISPGIKKRFPSLDYIVDSGLMTQEECRVYTELNSPHHKYWVPCHWAVGLLSRARQAGWITDEYSFNLILDQVNQFKIALGMLYSYDWISIPLVYTQVSTISVYIFFFTSIISRQFIDPEASKEIIGSTTTMHVIDIYVPLLTVLQLFFYLGLLKVAEQMINPFGEDDDDFEVNWIIDRNFQVGLLSVDDMYDNLPTIEKDHYWGDSDAQLPYTKATLRYYSGQTWQGSVAQLDINPDVVQVIPMDTIQEQDDILESEADEVIASEGDVPIKSMESVLSNNDIKRRLGSTAYLQGQNRASETFSSTNSMIRSVTQLAEEKKRRSRRKPRTSIDRIDLLKTKTNSRPDLNSPTGASRILRLSRKRRPTGGHDSQSPTENNSCSDGSCTNVNALFPTSNTRNRRDSHEGTNPSNIDVSTLALNQKLPDDHPAEDFDRISTEATFNYDKDRRSSLQEKDTLSPLSLPRTPEEDNESTEKPTGATDDPGMKYVQEWMKDDKNEFGFTSVPLRTVSSVTELKTADSDATLTNINTKDENPGQTRIIMEDTTPTVESDTKSPDVSSLTMPEKFVTFEPEVVMMEIPSRSWENDSEPFLKPLIEANEEEEKV